MINTLLTIAGTTYDDFIQMKVDVSNDEYLTSSEFKLIFDNPFGRHSSHFSIGDEVIIYADKDTDPATTKLFTGIIEEIRFDGRENSQKVELTGRDYTQRLMDITIEPIVYTASEISTIITNILINANITDITTTNVNVTSTTLARISFNQIPIYDAFTQLAELAGFYFYIDADKDLHFEQKKNISSGLTFDNTNILEQTFDTTRKGMANDVWVYGDRQLAGYKEQLSGDGGSVFTLISKPHNTFIEYLGNPLRGAVYQMATVPESGTNYLISYFDKQLIFASGTDLGYDSTPISGGSVLVTYDREIPIVKHGVERDSIAVYGQKNKIINDKSIRDPQTATDILKQQLDNADPYQGMVVDLKGWYTLLPGQTVNTTMSDFGLNSTELPILSVKYIFDKNTIYLENVIRVKFNKKIKDLTDELAKMNKRLDAIESADRQDTDIITRLEQATGSLLVVGSHWEVRTRNIAGLNLILDSPSFGLLDTNTLASGTTRSWVLGHSQSSILGTSTLGQVTATFITVASGGYSY